MKSKQSSLFSLVFNSIAESHKYYAKQILYKLYPDIVLNKQQMYAIFLNQHQTLVKASIKDLEGCMLIHRVDNNKGIYCEKKYALTIDGKELINWDSTFNI